MRRPIGWVFGLLCASVCCLDAYAAAPPIVIGPYVAAEFDEGFAIHGVGGDRTLLFAVQPSFATRPRGVHIARRIDGRDLGELPAPPGGWGTPLTIKIESFENQGALRTSGTFVLLDNTVPPALAGTAPAKIYRYAYSYAPHTGFSATLLSTHVLPLNTQPPTNLPDGTVYPGSIALLPGGGLVLTDNFTGALWVSDASLNNWRMALIDPRLIFGPGEDVTGTARAQGGGTRPYTLRVPSPPGLPPMYPGVHSIAYCALTDEVAFVRTATPGGIWAISRASLLDELTPPFFKTIREVVAPTPGVSDLTDGLDYDRFHPTTKWLYWQRAADNTLRRVNLQTGAIETLAQSNTVFDWANEITVLPSPFGVLDDVLKLTYVLSSVGQEHNNPDVNVLLNGVPTYVSPSLMPITIIDRR